ncbi:MAG: UvrABC system protein B [candidate division WS6 bacterium GW2011_GWF2_39_15]|uniref:UvrABC system protein B n=1 Tax=candidate division WS6 bacterium GW2011_GWF2_39_15 TaxID=1619100 RepID=A0A0G0QWR0_9BACT|nr:MAG: UvrABC system protein B [candidate division WS6 bacterium GW2011_GWF2_39_15]
MRKDNPFNLQSKYSPSKDQQIAIENLKSNVEKGNERQVLLGVTGSGKTYVMANIIKELNRPALILSHNKTLAAQLYEEFKEFFPDNAVKYFVSYYDYYQPEAYIPNRDLYIEKESEVNQQIERLRFSAMNAAVTRRDTIVVASVSCIYNIGSPDNYENKALTLRRGEEIELSKISMDLTLMRYNRQGEDFVPGSFRVKGDIVDVFMPYDDFPVRVEFWGNTIERISYIDAISTHKIKEIDEVEIYPATSLVYGNDVIEGALVKIEKDLNDRVSFLRSIGKELEAHRLLQKTRYDMEMIREVGFCKSMENYSIYFDGRSAGDPPYTLLDYFPKDYLLFVDESHITIPQVRGMYNGDSARKDNLVEYGFRLPSAKDNRPLKFSEFQSKQGNTIYYSATPDEWEITDSKGSLTELLTRPTGLLDPKVDIRPTNNQIDDVIEEVRKNIEKKQRVLITTLTKKMAEDLAEYLRDLDIKVQYLHSDVDTVERVDILRDLRLGEYDVLVGINLLREGIDLPEVSLVIILDADKEGFLRSKTSLVQTIGRAARHVEGRVIMYADSLTESMKYAISETQRRRKYQEEYNKKKGITPQSIIKAIRDRLVEKSEEELEFDYSEWIKGAKPPKSEIKRVIKDLEDKMHLYASNLQFEKAAEIRDQIKDLNAI